MSKLKIVHIKDVKGGEIRLALLGFSLLKDDGCTERFGGCERDLSGEHGTGAQAWEGRRCHVFLSGRGTFITELVPSIPHERDLTDLCGMDFKKMGWRAVAQ